MKITDLLLAASLTPQHIMQPPNPALPPIQLPLLTGSSPNTKYVLWDQWVFVSPIITYIVLQLEILSVLVTALSLASTTSISMSSIYFHVKYLCGMNRSDERGCYVDTHRSY